MIKVFMRDDVLLRNGYIYILQIQALYKMLIYKDN